MKKTMKKILSVGLGLITALSIIPVTPKVASAKTIKKQSRTLYTGEVLSLTPTYNWAKCKITKYSNSKKSVATVKRASDKKSVKITAKKTGKTVIKLKTSKGTFQETITVKKMDLSYSLKKLPNGYVLMTVKNNTKQTFDSAKLSVTLKGADGLTLGDPINVFLDYLPAKKKAYKTFTYNSYSYDPDLSKTKIKRLYTDRSFDAKYYDYSSKLKVSVSKKKAGTDYSLTTKTKNTCSISLNANNFIFLYDKNNNLLGMRTDYEYVKGHETKKSLDMKVYSISYPEFDHVKVKTIGIYKKY